jgi:hypothetical protein
MEGLVASDEFAKDEGFEEPTGVGEMPFNRAGLGTGLDHKVFRRQWSTKIAGGLADGFVASQQGRGGQGFWGCGQRHGLLALQSRLDAWLELKVAEI